MGTRLRLSIESSMSLETTQSWGKEYGCSAYRMMYKKFANYMPGVIRLKRILATAWEKLLVVNEFRKAALLLTGVKIIVK